MDEKLETVEAIDTKLEEISEEVANAETEEQVSELENKVETLEEEKRSLIENAEKRAEMLKEVCNAKVGIQESAEEERKEIMNEVNYRSAYFKKLMGKELNEEERALTTTTTAVIPEETSNSIFAKAIKLVPVLNEIELFHVNGGIKFAVETTRAAAGYHDENSTGINVDATAVLTEVKLGGYEFTKLIQVSQSMLNQSTDAFENWLTDMLAESIATAVENEIINGTGSSSVKGVNAITYTDTVNAVQYTTNLTAAEVREAIGYLPAFYDRGAKFLMSKKTLFTQFMGLQDNAKHDLIRVEGNEYYVYGYPVILSDKVAAGVAFLGNFKKYVGNMSQAIEVKSQFDINTNSYKYLGVCEFDGKPAAEDAFVKIGTSL